MCGKSRDQEKEQLNRWRRTPWEEHIFEGHISAPNQPLPPDIDLSDVPEHLEEQYPLPNHNQCLCCGEKTSYDVLTNLRGKCRDCFIRNSPPRALPFARTIREQPPYTIVMGREHLDIDKSIARLEAMAQSKEGRNHGGKT